MIRNLLAAGLASLTLSSLPGCAWEDASAYNHKPPADTAVVRKPEQPAPSAPRVNVFENDGIVFAYPADWAVVRDASPEGPSGGRELRLIGPGNAELRMLWVAERAPLTLEDFAAGEARHRVESGEAKVVVAKVQPASFDADGTSRVDCRIAGKVRIGLRQLYDATAPGRPVPHETDFFLLRAGNYKIFLSTQASESQLSSARKDWRQIFDSLVLDGLE